MTLTVLANQAAVNAAAIAANDADIDDIRTTLGVMDGDTMLDIVTSLEPFLADGNATQLFEAVATHMRDNPTTVRRNITHGIAGLVANTTYLVFRDEISGNILLADNDLTPASGEAGGVEAILRVGATVTQGDLFLGNVAVIPSHGFTLGQTYFVGENGLPSATVPTNGTDAFLQPAFVVWDANTLIRITQLPQEL
jgi:hypothetical protein